MMSSANSIERRYYIFVS
jgi:hypothetical protein